MTDLYLQEHFADYAPILPSLFSLNHIPGSSKPLYGSSPNTWDPKALDWAVQGLIAVLLSLKKKPVIRYEKSSPMAKKLGTEIQVCPCARTLYLFLADVIDAAQDSNRAVTLRISWHTSATTTTDPR